MTETIDRDALRARYREERDKRIRMSELPVLSVVLISMSCR